MDQDDRNTVLSRFTVPLIGIAALLLAQSGLAITTDHVPTTPGSYPFFSAITDIAAQGYVEDEYFVSGTANIYEYNASYDVEVMTADVPYTTRIMIRRPTNPNNFNGVVVFEMLNPTASWDIDFIWQYTQKLLMREGYIWVGLTVRDNAVAALKGFDPVRYAPIDLSERGLSYDTFGAIAVLLRDPLDPENPLADYNVNTVLGAGYSQTGDWLTTFSNEFHDSTLAWDGNPAFGGYLGAGGNGAAHAIWSGDPEAEFGAYYADDRRYNTVDAPYFRIHSETEVDVFFYSAVTARQPDSSTFRQWEVPGTSHADAPSTRDISATIHRDLGFPLPPCDAPVGDVAMAPYISAALHALTEWVESGNEPAPSLHLAWDGEAVIRDAHGNALGGIRIPEVEAPVGTYLPFNSGLGPCRLASTFEAFSPELIEILYPNHGRYVGKVARAVTNLVRDGYLLNKDASDEVDEAANSDTGH